MGAAVDPLAEIEGIAAARSGKPEAVPGHGVNPDIGNHIAVAECTVGAGIGGIVEIVVTDRHPVIAVGALEAVVIAVQQTAAVNLQRAERGGGIAAAVVELDVRIAAVNQALFEAQLLEGLASGRIVTEDHIGLAVLAARHGTQVTIPESDIRQGVLDDNSLNIGIGVTDAELIEAEIAGIHQHQGGGGALTLQHDIPALSGGGSKGHNVLAASSGEGAFEFDILIHPFCQAHLHRTAHTALVKGEYRIGQGGEVATGTHGVAAGQRQRTTEEVVGQGVVRSQHVGMVIQMDPHHNQVVLGLSHNRIQRNRLTLVTGQAALPLVWRLAHAIERPVDGSRRDGGVTLVKQIDRNRNLGSRIQSCCGG